MATIVSEPRPAEGKVIQLNDSQLDAVTRDSKRLLMLAGPGTGKTETLTERISHYIGERGIPPSSLLMFTYTNKAANNMTQRVRGKLASRASIVSGTFHSLCYRLIRQEFCPKGIFPDYKVLPEHHSNRLRAEAAAEFNAQNGKLAAAALKDIKGPVLLELYERKTKLNLQPNFLSGLGDEIQERKAELTEYAQGISKLYETLKQQYQVMDFNDLLFRFLRLLQDYDDVRQLLQYRFPHIYVDEYQDTNKVQVEILKQLVTPDSYLTVVGDDTQSIYSFQGSEVDKIRNFDHDFPGADIVVLDVNYRSSAPLVRYVNALNATCVGALTKTLVSGGPKSEIRPKLATFTKDTHEAAWVLEEINHLVSVEKVPLHEIAVLFRMSSIVEALERKLQKESIPYTREGGIKFAQLKHIQFFVSFLELLENPYNWLAWEVMLPIVPRIGTELTKIILSDLQANQGQWSWDMPPVFSLGHGKRLSSLLTFWQDLAEASRLKKRENVREYLEGVLPLFTRIYMRYFETQGSKKMILLESPTQLPDSMDDHIQDIRDYIIELSTSYIGLVKDFISEIASSNDMVERRRGLTLSTIHSSKGLEWTAVFVIGNTENVFPSRGWGLERNDFEEERRLYYVACSRAKKFLYVSGAHAYRVTNGNYKGQISRFATDPKTVELLEKVKEPNSDPFHSVNPHRQRDYVLTIPEAKGEQ